MDSLNTTTANEVVRQNLLRAAQATIADLIDSGQIESGDALALTAEVSKALATIPEGVGDIEVLKALDYGAQTSDAALLTGGGALTGAMPQHEKFRLAKEMRELTDAGLSPVSKAQGYAVPEDLEEFRLDVADVFMQEYGVADSDALDCTEMFFKLYGA